VSKQTIHYMALNTPQRNFVESWVPHLTSRGGAPPRREYFSQRRSGKTTAIAALLTTPEEVSIDIGYVAGVGQQQFLSNVLGHDVDNGKIVLPNGVVLHLFDDVSNVIDKNMLYFVENAVSICGVAPQI
jgi:hypothetical protein